MTIIQSCFTDKQQGVEIVSISYWLNLDTNNVYEIDEDTSNGMSFLNDKTLNLKQTTKQHYLNQKGDVK